MYEYRCVPAPMRLIVKNEKDNRGRRLLAETG